MQLKGLLAVTVALIVAGPVQASLNAAPADKSPVQMDVQESIAEQLLRVDQALANEAYSELSAEDRQAVRDALGRIRVNVGDSASVAALAPDLRTAVYNDQELINTLLGKAHADSRMVCERVRLTGSNRREQVCMTVAQRREMRENSVDVLRNWNHWNTKKD